MAINAHQFGPWAVVTGASSGIGLEFTRQLAAAGISVVLIARRLERLHAIGEEVSRRHDVDYRAIAADLSEPGAAGPIAEGTADLDVGMLVSNAGAALPGPLTESDLQAQLAVLRLNTAAHLGLTHHFAQGLARRGRGGILLVSALGAVNGVPYMAHTAATKAYVASFGAGLHLELAKQGVHVTVLHPGPTRTAAIAEIGLDPDKLPIPPMSPKDCATEALRALARNRARCIPGRINRLTAAIAPPSVTRSMMGRMLSRPADIGSAPE